MRGRPELTRRELQVVSLAARGFTNKGMAIELGISYNTLKNYVTNIYDKLAVFTMSGAVVAAILKGYIDMPKLEEVHFQKIR